jgi:predicted DCC family thiol-disulfide oxidoreductase YuxK
MRHEAYGVTESGQNMKQEDQSPTQLDKALVIYDGGCGFCEKWIKRWRRITGDSVEYRSSAEVGALFPEIPASEFDRAVQLIRLDGSRCSGAEAVLEITAPHNWAVHLLWLAYQKNITIRSALETTYRFVAAHRAKIPCSIKKSE